MQEINAELNNKFIIASINNQLITNAYYGDNLNIRACYRLLAHWWTNLSDKGRAKYLEKHPLSKYKMTYDQLHDVPLPKEFEKTPGNIPKKVKQVTPKNKEIKPKNVPKKVTPKNNVKPKINDEIKENKNNELIKNKKVEKESKLPEVISKNAKIRSNIQKKIISDNSWHDNNEESKLAHKSSYVDNLNDEEHDSLHDYTNHSYEAINKYLRKGNYNLKNKEHWILEDLKSAFNKAKTKNDITTYRGINSAAFSEMVDSMQPGDTFIDKGYSSTSTNKQNTENFADSYNGFKNGVIMKIIVPKGSKAISLMGLNDEFIKEKEILLNNNAKFKVLKIIPATDSSPKVLEVEYS